MHAEPAAPATVLMVDDEAANLDLLEEFLGPEHACLVRTTDAREVMPLFEAHAPDLVLLDLHMPHLSGFELLVRLRERTAPGDFVPVLVLTADATRATRARALADGAQDFLTKPLDALEVRLRVRNLLAARRLHREQRVAREAAEAATAARELVLSVVAHDLRNPLAAVMMDAEMVGSLLPDRATPQHRAVLRIQRAARHMHQLIDDLLDIARLEAGTFAVDPQPLAPRELLAEAEAMLRPLAAGLALEFAGPAELPSIRADGGRLLQVLSNLVGNALKFTPRGGSVSVAWHATPDELVVSVSDTGPGIPVDQLPHVFDAFWQGHAERRRGVGLGLLITRAIVEAHGGSVVIESAPGAGTTVRFAIPLAGTPAAPRSVDPCIATVAH